MERMLRRFIPALNDHLSDDRMASLFCHGLPFTERQIARQHLAICWRCRVRMADLEGRRADRVVGLYRAALDSEDRLPPAMARAQFAQRLERHIQDAAPRRWWIFRSPNISLPELPSMNLTMACCMVFGLATAISFLLWRQQRVPDITSNALLVRAERWDSTSLANSTGVVYQSVRITTPKQTMERSIYRDLQGKRQPRRVKLTERQELLRNTLVQVGLNWDEPLSASGYQGWHDHQRVRSDQIVRAGTHLLKLTTIVPEGSVSAQSLTVRDTDFHPVQRTIAFRDSETVEIAEVDFKILPWNAVDANVFDAIESMPKTMPAIPARVIPFPRLPETPSQAQLDETELDARLILNQLHADTGEQIEIERTPRVVEVKGLVETGERKRILQMQLKTVPHLVVSIKSVAELENETGANDNATSVKTASMPDQPSPLETYLLGHGRSVSAINMLAQRLFDTALTISQESHAIGDLRARFSPDERTSILASATLSELIYSHHERLQAALKQERELLNEIEPLPAQDSVSAERRSSLAEVAIENLDLCKELTQTNRSATRSAEKILAAMSNSMGALDAHAHEAYGKPLADSTPLSGKR